MKIEVLECDGYHHIAIDGKLVTEGSCDDLLDEVMENLPDIQYVRTVLDDSQTDLYYEWAEARGGRKTK